MSILKPAAEAFVDLITNSNNEQYLKFEAEIDTEKIIGSLKLVEQLFPDQVLMLCNRSHPALHYVSANSEKVLGHPADYFMSLTVFDFLKLIHPDDLKGLEQCFDFINSSEPYDPVTHRFVLYYRIKNGANKYIHVRDEKLAIKNDNERYVYFTLFKNESYDEKFFHVKLDIYQQTKSRLLKVYTFNPRQSDNTITPRQNDIVKLIIRGFSNQEIADQLNLSVNTIKNHKQLLFKKTNVRNSVELVSYARGALSLENVGSDESK